MFLLFRVVGNQIQEMLGNPLMNAQKESAAPLGAKVGSSIFFFGLKIKCAETRYKKQACGSDPGLGFFAERPKIVNIFNCIFPSFHLSHFNLQLSLYPSRFKV